MSVQLDIFYNTTHKEGEELKVSRSRVKGQTEKILRFFEQHPRTWFSPWDVYFHMGQQMMITSVRRSITTLTDAGKLEKGGKENRKTGHAGETNYTWRLRTKYSIIKNCRVGRGPTQGALVGVPVAADSTHGRDQPLPVKGSDS